jgi:hypothetical protein
MSLLGRRTPWRLSLAGRAAATLFVVLACGGSEPRYARFDAPWTRFVAGDGMAGAYDASRLVTRGDTVVVWMRFQYAAPQPVPGDPARTFSVTEVHQAVRCGPALTSDRRMLLRDSVGDSVAGYTPPARRWVPFVEHGLSDRVLVRLCRALPRS